MEHVHQLRLVHRGHDRHARDGPQVGEVEAAVVGGAVVADEAAAVDREHHRQVLDGGVVDDRVERALQERRVDGAHRPEAVDREAAGEHDRVLLGDADVVRPLGERRHHVLHPRALEHRGGDADDARVALGLRHEGVAEDVGVVRRAGLLLAGGLAALDDERGGAVHGLAVGLGRRVAAALDRLDVDERRAVHLEGGPQRLAHAVDVVAVDRPDVGEAERLEQRAGDEPQGLGGVADLAAQLAGAGEPREAALELLAHLGERRVDADALEELGEGADVLRDAHAVVVEHHGDRRPERAGLVEALVRHAAGEGAVADDGDHAAVAAWRGAGPRRGPWRS